MRQPVARIRHNGHIPATRAYHTPASACSNMLFPRFRPPLPMADEPPQARTLHPQFSGRQVHTSEGKDCFRHNGVAHTPLLRLLCGRTSVAEPAFHSIGNRHHMAHTLLQDEVNERGTEGKNEGGKE